MQVINPGDWPEHMQKCSECPKKLATPQDAHSYSHYHGLAWCSLKCKQKWYQSE